MNSVDSPRITRGVLRQAKSPLIANVKTEPGKCNLLLNQYEFSP